VAPLSPRELHEVERAERSGKPVVVFVHGLWLLAGSWRRWRALFEGAGYATIAPGWPGEPETVEAAQADPAAQRRTSLQSILAHHRELIGHLSRAPALVGHCAGGLVVQQLAAEGIASTTVALQPTKFRGVLPLSVSELRSFLPVLRRPSNVGRAVRLTFEEFQYSWANALDPDEARKLYDEFHVATPGLLLFQAAAANANPVSAARVDTRADRRGPLLLIAGEHDHSVPWAVTYAIFKQQRRNPSPTEIVELPGRGHTLTIDHGWPEAAIAALSFVERHVDRLPPDRPTAETSRTS
jgi:pimeloyl-ACP methyl ester carboxylesterase